MVAFTLSILFTKDFGPVILTFSGISCQASYFIVFPGFRITSAYIHYELLCFLFIQIHTEVLRGYFNIIGVTPGTEQVTVMGTITGFVSRLTACCRSAVAVISETLILSLIFLFVVIAILIESCFFLRHTHLADGI